MDTDKQTLLRIRNLIRQALEIPLEIIKEDKSVKTEESDNSSETKRTSLLISRRQPPIINSIPRISFNELKLKRPLVVHRSFRISRCYQRKIEKRLQLEYSKRMLLSQSSRSLRLLSITDASPLPSLHAARQIFDGLPMICPTQTAEENIQTIENLQHNELLMNMAAMNIEESTSTSH